MSNTSPHNTTSGDGLSPVQETVLAALLAGQKITDAAKAAGVDRTTIYRWLKDSDRPAFRCALNRGRRELRQATRARLLALADKAVDSLEVAFAEGDGKAALALLKGLGLLRGQSR